MKQKSLIEDALLIPAGCLSLALGLNLFLVPIKLSPGGVSTLGTIFLYLFHVPLSVTNLALNAVLFLLGYRYLGKASSVKTLAGILLLSLFLQLTSHIPPFTEDVLLATILGGLLAGFGIGLVVRQEGSTGGSDLVSLLLHRFFPHISVSTFFLVIDCVIIALAGIVFSSLAVAFYSSLSLYIAAKVADFILTMGNLAKSIYIISPKGEEISEVIMERFARGVTGIYSKGMYSGSSGMMLLCVVSPKELPSVVHTVRNLDPNAFLIISDAREVMGEGFRK
ncbi:MAG: YitT family protein [Clostridia bacterium]|nr:YitT family protein [Clostridia bacterium]